MPAWLLRNPLVIALSALALILALVIAVEMGVGGLLSLPGAAPKRAAASDAKLLPSLAAVSPEQAYPESTARPLFTPTRRPAPEPVVQTAVVRGQFILVGTTVAGPTRIAMLREKASGRIHRVESGKDINGIKVTKVEPESVTLGHGGENEVLTLQYQRLPGAPGGPQGNQPMGGGAPFMQQSTGPFGPITAPGVASVPPGSVGAVPAPGAAIPPPQPGGAPPQGQQSLAVPGVSFMPPSSAPVNAPASANSQATPSPMSPEELLARRRARRAQQTQ